MAKMTEVAKMSKTIETAELAESAETAYCCRCCPDSPYPTIILSSDFLSTEREEKSQKSYLFFQLLFRGKGRWFSEMVCFLPTSS